jgi:hopene-associated glycosyltransferase HpnB
VPVALSLVGTISVFLWLYLFLARGWFWRLRAFEDDRTRLIQPLTEWPRIVAVVPARNETKTIGEVVAALAKQEYPGEFSVVIVDDHSEDATTVTAERAAAAADATSLFTVHKAPPLPAGWTGKLWAMNEGVGHAAARAPAFYWFTDADVVHAPDTLQRLVVRAEHGNLDLVSLMVLLRAKTLAERALIPPFLYFFLKLYPPRWVADAHARTAGAAGGCILQRRKSLDRVGGLAVIRSELIDDCALARRVKEGGGRIWMGLTRGSVSLRAYSNFGEILDMIARTAFTQLRHSRLLLFGTLGGMILSYIAPVALVFAEHSPARILGLASWLLMSLSFIPTVRFYRLSLVWAPLLPLAAVFYTYATCLSAARFWRGSGGQWKGRVQALPRVE